MIRHLLFATACAFAFLDSTSAADSVSRSMPLILARQVVNETVELVEAEGLYPRKQTEYVRAKKELLASIAGDPSHIDRQTLYWLIRKLLLTLDVDGHSFIIPPDQASQSLSPIPQDDAHPPLFTLVQTRYGTVLRWAPPAIIGSSKKLYEDYLKEFYENAAAHPDLAKACALVIDLSNQTGGNAWPPFIAMYPLFSGANKARWVDRDGKRIPFVVRSNLEKMNYLYAGNRPNPLTQFANAPLAVIVSERTASAGEMLLVALLGEDRVQSFGRSSAGMSTANGTHQLADGSTLVLTKSRYALDDGPVYRGRIAPMHPVDVDGSMITTIKIAAERVAKNSASCRVE